MFITLSPMRRDGTLTLHRAGDVLTINGTSFDFGPLPEGAVLPRSAVNCEWLASDVTRIGGRIHLTLILPHGPIPYPAPPEAAAVLFPAPPEAAAVLFPAALDLTANGPVQLPTIPVEEAAE